MGHERFLRVWVLNTPNHGAKISVADNVALPIDISSLTSAFPAAYNPGIPDRPAQRSDSARKPSPDAAHLSPHSFSPEGTPHSCPNSVPTSVPGIGDLAVATR